MSPEFTGWLAQLWKNQEGGFFHWGMSKCQFSVGLSSGNLSFLETTQQSAAHVWVKNLLPVLLEQNIGIVSGAPAFSMKTLFSISCLS